jgi:hypothetical protein
VILQILAACNFFLGSYDAWVTQHRMKLFGKNFELNRLIKSLSTHLGPEIASVIGVLGPCVGWTYIFCYFNLLWALALMVGFNLKRFEQQLTSVAFEREARKIQKMINEFGASNPSTLHGGESTPSEAPFNSKRGK